MISNNKKSQNIVANRWHALRRTIGLIVLCVIVSLLYWYLGDGQLTGLLGFSGESFLQGRFWVVLTALFVHGSLLHLAGNMLFLYVFGSNLESEVGATKTVLAFFTGGVLSFILSVYFYGLDTVIIGTSAAVFTLTAIVMLTKPLSFSWAFFMPLGLVAILYFIYNLAAVSILGGEASVGYWGHIIGFVIGLPFGIAWSRGKWARNLLMATMLLVAYLILAYFIGPSILSLL